jgi:hypothetical protein
MKQENVDINIGSKLDAKGFKQAETALSKLNKSVKSAAGAIGIAYGARAITQFGIASVKAFAQDEAAALRLTTAVDNLGISFANPQIASYISNLEKTAMIADDVLRPAFQGLLTTTGSLTQSQKLLNDAITISRGTGVELSIVSQDLANGYIGITKGLKKYNTGLTTSELATKSFSEVLGVLLKQSSGAANAYLDTTSFKFDVLTIATDNAREMIGKGLVDALARVSGGTEATDAAKTIDFFAASIYQLEIRLGGAIGAVPTLLSKLKSLPKEIFMGFAGKQFGVNLTPNVVVPPKVEISKTAQQLALEKLEKEAAARAKKLLDMQNKAAKLALAAQKKAEALKKAGTLFDLEQTQVIAALKGNISADERKRLELQLAILTGNTTEASKLAGQLAYSQGLTKELVAFLKNLPDAKNPFSAWASYLDAIEAQVKRIAVGGTSGGGTAAVTGTSMSSGNGMFDPSDFLPQIPGGKLGAGFNQPGTVIVNVAGSVVSEGELVDAVRNGLINSSLSGAGSLVARRTGTFATL